MIVDALLDVVFGGVTWLVELLPEADIDLSGLVALSGSLAWLGYVFNMPALVGAIGTAVAVEAGMVGFRVALFVWRLTPLSG